MVMQLHSAAETKGSRCATRGSDKRRLSEGHTHHRSSDAQVERLLCAESGVGEGRTKDDGRWRARIISIFVSFALGSALAVGTVHFFARCVQYTIYSLYFRSASKRLPCVRLISNLARPAGRYRVPYTTSRWRSHFFVSERTTFESQVSGQDAGEEAVARQLGCTCLGVGL